MGRKPRSVRDMSEKQYCYYKMMEDIRVHSPDVYDEILEIEAERKKIKSEKRKKWYQKKKLKEMQDGEIKREGEEETES